jgi:transposase, IS5 family
LESFEQTLGAPIIPARARPGISTRLMVALHYLKYQHDLSDEDVVAAWVENPYWQHFSGMSALSASDADRSVEHDALAQAAGRGRSRADAARHDRSGHAMRVIRPRVEAHQRGYDRADQGDSFPTDARLYQRMRERLVKARACRGPDHQAEL